MGFSIRGVSVCVLASLGVVGAAAAEPVLRLADVVAVAVRQSPELERAKIDAAAAQAQLQAAEGIEDSHVGAQITGTAIKTTPDDPDTLTTQTEVNAQASATVPLSTGARLALVAVVDRFNFSGFQPAVNGTLEQVAVAKRFTSTLSLQVTQPLLRGAGSTAFEAPIERAARQRDAASLQQEARARDLIVSLAQAYWQVAFAWRQLEIRKASLELAQKQLDYTQTAITVQKVPRSELLAVQQAMAIRKQDVIAGEQQVYEQSVALRQLAGLDIGPEAIAVTTEPLPAKISDVAPDVAGVVRVVFAHSPDLAALEASRHAAEIGVAAADNAARSRLDLSVSAGPLGAARTLSSSLQSGVSEPGYQLNGSLVFDHAIEQRSEHGGQAVARAALLTAKVAERDARARLAIRATRAAQRAKAALDSIALGDEAVSLAEQNITAEQARFSLGKSTNFDVLRRQEELEQARLRQSAAVVDYLAARAELDGLGGTLLARYHIVMP